MKKTLKKIWRSEKTDYAIQLAMIAVLGFAFFQVSDARDTLNNEGCTVYWQEYQPSVNLSEKTLVSKFEAEMLNKGLIPERLQKEENSSSFRGQVEDWLDQRQ